MYLLHIVNCGLFSFFFRVVPKLNIWENVEIIEVEWEYGSISKYVLLKENEVPRKVIP